MTMFTRVAGSLTLLLSVFSLPTGAFAQGPDEEAFPVEVGADLMTRLEVRNDYDSYGLVGRRLGEGDGMVYRARLIVGLPETEIGNGLRASVLFQPQATGYWGDVSGGLADPSVGMHQAKGRFAFGNGWFDVGRFEMAYGEHLVIGNVGWHETSRAFDGVRSHVEIGGTGAYIDAFATILREGSLVDAVSPLLGGDFYFLGMYAGVGPAIVEGLELDFYLLANVSPKTEDVPMPQTFTATEVTVGARAKQKIGIATLRGEGGYQLGERSASQNDVQAFQLDGDVMLALAPMAKAGVGGLYASGDDPNSSDLEGWNQLYPTAHKFLGLMDVMGGRSNVAGTNAKVRVKPLQELALSLGLDGHLFWRPETAMGVDGYTGFESDLWAMWGIADGLSLRSMYSFFLPNEDGPLGSDDIAHYVEVQFRYTR